jgi:hypothetical protein
MDRRKIFSLGFIIIVCSGCHSGPPPEFPDWATRFAQPSAKPESGTAFAEYCRAAEEAEREGGKYLDMVSFFPGQRKSAMEKTARALGLLESASGRKCDFDFQATGPFKAPPYQRGWRLLGRDLVWKIQQAIQEQKYGEAVAAANVATKFGFDISGGGATDASLGFAIVNEARQAIAPALNHMDAGQLSSLAAGVSRALENKPDLKTTIDHERANMLLGVQAIQDAYRSNNFDNVTRTLGPDMRSAIDFLNDLHRKDTTKRPQYFASFASEAESEVQWMETVADEPVAERTAHPEPRLKGDRPWRKFAKNFFTSVGPLLKMNDDTLARTRLLILNASILEQVKSRGAAPKDLSEFPAELKTDPFTGKPFIYGADGADYHVYSVGANLRDDGGETDETYTQPDLKIESGN